MSFGVDGAAKPTTSAPTPTSIEQGLPGTALAPTSPTMPQTVAPAAPVPVLPPAPPREVAAITPVNALQPIHSRYGQQTFATQDLEAKLKSVAQLTPAGLFAALAAVDSRRAVIGARLGVLGNAGEMGDTTGVTAARLARFTAPQIHVLALIGDTASAAKSASFAADVQSLERLFARAGVDASQITTLAQPTVDEASDAIASAIAATPASDILVVIHTGESTPKGLVFQGQELSDAHVEQLAVDTKTNTAKTNLLLLFDTCWGGIRVDALRSAKIARAVSEHKLAPDFAQLDQLRADLVELSYNLAWTKLAAVNRDEPALAKAFDLAQAKENPPGGAAGTHGFPTPDAVLAMISHAWQTGDPQALEDLSARATQRFRDLKEQALGSGADAVALRHYLTYCGNLGLLARTGVAIARHRALLTDPRFAPIVDHPILTGRAPLHSDEDFITTDLGGLMEQIEQTLEQALSRAVT